MKHSLILAAAATLLVACGGKQATAPAEALSANGRTQATENLLASLLKLSASDSTYMFGQHDAVCYGLGWRGDENRSDCQSVCGDMPAVLSFDLGHLELGDTVNLDGVPFSQIRREAISHYDRGGMVTMSWHLDNPLTGGTAWTTDSLREQEQQTVASILPGGEQHQKFLGWLDSVAEFISSLQNDYGQHVPVLFRPWHEHTGSWFWWGQQLCTTEQYKQLWQLTVSRLKEQGVTNVLYAYSPGTEPDGDADRYLERYPGDDLIDLLGLDCYCFATEGDSTQIANYAQQLERNLSMVCRVAAEHHKPAALTETGYEGVKAPDWWTATLAPVLAHLPISYVLVWRNADNKPGHFYVPYPGHPAAPDFVRFYNLPATLFLRDVNGLYL